MMLATGERVTLNRRPVTGKGTVLYRSPVDRRRLVVRLDTGGIISPFEHDVMRADEAENGPLLTGAKQDGV